MPITASRLGQRTFADGQLAPVNDGLYLERRRYHYDGASREFLYEEYHPYGTSAYRAVDASVDVSAKRYRYTGMERDEETGLGYHSARYYVPWLGRWSGADPIGIRGGINVYEYAASAPSNLRDGKGTSPYAIDPSLPGAQAPSSSSTGASAGRCELTQGNSRAAQAGSPAERANSPKHATNKLEISAGTSTDAGTHNLATSATAGVEYNLETRGRGRAQSAFRLDVAGRLRTGSVGRVFSHDVSRGSRTQLDLSVDSEVDVRLEPAG